MSLNFHGFPLLSIKDGNYFTQFTHVSFPLQTFFYAKWQNDYSRSFFVDLWVFPYNKFSNNFIITWDGKKKMVKICSSLSQQKIIMLGLVLMSFLGEQRQGDMRKWNLDYLESFESLPGVCLSSGLGMIWLKYERESWRSTKRIFFVDFLGLLMKKLELKFYFLNDGDLNYWQNIFQALFMRLLLHFVKRWTFFSILTHLNLFVWATWKIGGHDKAIVGQNCEQECK